MDQYLQETQFMNFKNDVIQENLQKLDLNGLSDTEKAIKLFQFVRDSSKYSVKGISFDPQIFVASNTLQRKSSFCIPKAVALATLGRAVGIPSRIHFVDFVNHRLTPELVDLWGTNIMAPHCFTEFYLEGKWVKATPALDRDTCETHDFILPEFDGQNDAILQPFDKNGKPHAEYIVDHGPFADVDLKFIKKVIENYYGNMSIELIDKIFSGNTFKKASES